MRPGQAKRPCLRGRRRREHDGRYGRRRVGRNEVVMNGMVRTLEAMDRVVVIGDGRLRRLCVGSKGLESNVASASAIVVDVFTLPSRPRARLANLTLGLSPADALI